jgi:pentatricopeptide repeat protein
VFDGMKKYGFVPDIHSRNIFVEGLCKQGYFLTWYDVLDEMARNEIAPTLVSWSLLLHGLCRAGNVYLAFGLFSWLKDKGFKHFFR